MINDLEFIQRCVRGDKQAWDEFVDKYSRLIYSYIHGILKIRSQNFTQENINDIFQEIFLSLIKDNFKKLKSFKAKNGCSLATWLRQVTVNLTIDHMRRFHPAISLDEENEEGSNLKDILRDIQPKSCQYAKMMQNHGLQIPKHRLFTTPLIL